LLQTDVGVVLQQKEDGGNFVVVGVDGTTAGGVCVGDVLFSVDRVPVAGLKDRDALRMLNGRRGACMCFRSALGVCFVL
jgi:C-terminal processing protease CtpA/Prc